MKKNTSHFRKILAGASSTAIILSCAANIYAGTVETNAATATIGDGNATTGTIGTPIWNSGDDLKIHDNGVTVTTSGNTTFGNPSIDFNGKTGVTIETADTINANNITFTDATQSLKLNENAIINAELTAYPGYFGTVNVQGNATINHQNIGVTRLYLSRINLNSPNKTLTIHNQNLQGEYNLSDDFHFVADGTLSFEGEAPGAGAQLNNDINAKILADSGGASGLGTILLAQNYSDLRRHEFKEIGDSTNYIKSLQVDGDNTHVYFSNNVYINEAVISGSQSILDFFPDHVDGISSIIFKNSDTFITNAVTGTATGATSTKLTTNNIYNKSGSNYSGGLLVGARVTLFTWQPAKFEIIADIGDSTVNGSVLGPIFIYDVYPLVLQGDNYYANSFSNSSGGKGVDDGILTMQSSSPGAIYNISAPNIDLRLSSFTIGQSGGAGLSALNFLDDTKLDTNELNFSAGYDHTLTLGADTLITRSDTGTSIINFTEANQKLTFARNDAVINAEIRSSGAGKGIIEAKGDAQINSSSIGANGGNPINAINISRSNHTLTLNQGANAGTYNIANGVNFYANGTVKFPSSGTASLEVNSDFINQTTDNYQGTIRIDNDFVTIKGNIGASGGSAIDGILFGGAHPLTIEGDRIHTRNLNLVASNRGDIDIRAASAGTPNFTIETYMPDGTSINSLNLKPNSSNAAIATNMELAAGSILRATKITMDNTLDHSVTLLADSQITDNSNSENGVVFSFPTANSTLNLNDGSIFRGSPTAANDGFGIINTFGNATLESMNIGTANSAISKLNINTANANVTIDNLSTGGSATYNTKDGIHFKDDAKITLLGTKPVTINSSIEADTDGHGAIITDSSVGQVVFGQVGSVTNNKAVGLINLRQSSSETIFNGAEYLIDRLITSTSIGAHIRFINPIAGSRISSIEFSGDVYLININGAPRYSYELISNLYNKSGFNNIGTVRVADENLSIIGNIGDNSATGSLKAFYIAAGSDLNIEGDHIYVNNMQTASNPGGVTVRAANAGADNMIIKTNMQQALSTFTIESKASDANSATNVLVKADSIVRSSNFNFGNTADHTITAEANSTLTNLDSAHSNINFTRENQKITLNDGCTLQALVNPAADGYGSIDAFGDVKIYVAGIGDNLIGAKSVNFKTDGANIIWESPTSNNRYYNLTDGINFDGDNMHLTIQGDAAHFYQGDINFTGGNTNVISFGDTIKSNNIFFDKIGDKATGKSLKLFDQNQHTGILVFNEEVNITKLTSSKSDDAAIYLRSTAGDISIDTLEFKGDTYLQTNNAGGLVTFRGNIINDSGTNYRGRIYPHYDINIIGDIGDNTDTGSLNYFHFSTNTNVGIEGNGAYVKIFNNGGGSRGIFHFKPAIAGADNFIINPQENYSNSIASLYLDPGGANSTIVNNTKILDGSIFRVTNLFFDGSLDHTLTLGENVFLSNQNDGTSTIHFSKADQKVIIGDKSTIFANMNANANAQGIVEIDGDATISARYIGTDSGNQLNAINVNTIGKSVQFNGQPGVTSTYEVANGLNLTSGNTITFANTNEFDLWEFPINVNDSDTDTIYIDNSVLNYMYFGRIGDLTTNKSLLKLEDNSKNGVIIFRPEADNTNISTLISTKNFYNTRPTIYLRLANARIGSLELASDALVTNLGTSTPLSLTSNIFNKTGINFQGFFHSRDFPIELTGNIGENSDTGYLQNVYVDRPLTIEGDHIYAKIIYSPANNNGTLTIKGSNVASPNFIINTTMEDQNLYYLKLDAKAVAPTPTNLEISENSIFLTRTIELMPGYDHTVTVKSGSVVSNTLSGYGTFKFNETNQKLILEDKSTIRYRFQNTNSGDGIIDVYGDVYIGASSIGTSTDGLKAMYLNTANSTVILDSMTTSGTSDYNFQDGIIFNADLNLQFISQNTQNLYSDIVLAADNTCTIKINNSLFSRSFRFRNKVGEIGGNRLSLLEIGDEGGDLYFFDEVHINNLKTSIYDGSIIYLRNSPNETNIDLFEFKGDARLTTDGGSGDTIFRGKIENTSGENYKGIIYIDDADLTIFGNIGSNGVNGAINGFQHGDQTVTIEGDYIYALTLSTNTANGTMVLKANGAGADNFLIETNMDSISLQNLTLADKNGDGSNPTNLKLTAGSSLRVENINFSSDSNHSITIDNDAKLLRELLQTTNIYFSKDNQKLILNPNSEIAANIYSTSDNFGLVEVYGDAILNTPYIGNSTDSIGKLSFFGAGANVTLNQSKYENNSTTRYINTQAGIEFNDDMTLNINGEDNLYINSTIIIPSDDTVTINYNNFAERDLYIEQIGDAGKSLKLLNFSAPNNTLYIRDYPVNIKTLAVGTHNTVTFQNPTNTAYIDNIELKSDTNLYLLNAGDIKLVGNLKNSSGEDSAGLVQIIGASNFEVIGNIGDSGPNGDLLSLYFNVNSNKLDVTGDHIYLNQLGINGTGGNINVRAKAPGGNFIIGTKTRGIAQNEINIEESNGAGITNVLTAAKSYIYATNFNFKAGHDHTFSLQNSSTLEAPNVNLTNAGQVLNMETDSLVIGDINTSVANGGIINVNGDASFDGTRIGNAGSALNVINLDAKLNLSQETKIYAPIEAANVASGSIYANENLYLYNDVGTLEAPSSLELKAGKSAFLLNSSYKINNIKLNSASIISNNGANGAVSIIGSVINNDQTNFQGIVDINEEFNITGDIGSNSTDGAIEGVLFTTADNMNIEGTKLYVKNLNIGAVDAGVINISSATAGGNFELFADMQDNALSQLNINTSGGAVGLSNVLVQDNANLKILNLNYQAGQNHKFTLEANSSINNEVRIEFTEPSQELNLNGNNIIGSTGHSAVIQASGNGIGIINANGDALIVASSIGNNGGNALNKINLNTDNITLRLDNDGVSSTFSANNGIEFVGNATLELAGNNDHSIIGNIISLDKGTIIVDQDIGAQNIQFSNDIATAGNALSNFINNSQEATISLSGTTNNIANLNLKYDTLIDLLGNSNTNLGIVVNDENKGTIQLSNDVILTMDNSAGKLLKTITFNGDRNLTIGEGSHIGANNIAPTISGDGTITAPNNAIIKTPNIGKGQILGALNLSGATKTLTLDNAAIDAVYNINDGINFVADANLLLQGDANITFNTPIKASNPNEGSVDIDATIGNRQVSFNDNFGSAANPIGSLTINSSEALIKFSGANTAFINTLTYANNTIIEFAEAGGIVEINQIINNANEGNFRISGNTQLKIDNNAGNSLSSIQFSDDYNLTLPDGSNIFVNYISSNNAGEGSIIAAGDNILKTDNIALINTINLTSSGKALTLNNNGSPARYSIINSINFSDNAILRLTGDADIEMDSAITATNSGHGTIIIDASILAQTVTFADNIGKVNPIGHLKIDSIQAKVTFEGNETDINLVTFADNTALTFSKDDASVRIGAVSNNVNEGKFIVSEDTLLEIDNSATNKLNNLLFTQDKKLTLTDSSAIKVGTISTNIAGEGIIRLAGDATLITNSIGTVNPINRIDIQAAGKNLTLDNAGTNAIYSANNGINFINDAKLTLTGDADISINSPILNHTGNQGTIIIDNSIGARIINFKDVGTQNKSISHIRNDSANADISFDGNTTNIDQLTLVGDTIVNFNQAEGIVNIGSLINNSNEGTFKVAANTYLYFDNQVGNPISDLNFPGDNNLTLNDNSAIYTDKISNANGLEGTINISGDATLKTNNIDIKEINILASNKGLIIDNNGNDAVYSSSAINFADNGKLTLKGDGNIVINSKIFNNNDQGTVNIDNTISNKDITFNNEVGDIGHIHNKSNNATLNFTGAKTKSDFLTLEGDTIINLSANTADVSFANVLTNDSNGTVRINEDTNLLFANNTGKAIKNLEFSADKNLTLTEGTYIHTDKISTNLNGEGNIISTGNVTIKTNNIGIPNNLNSISITNANKMLTLDNGDNPANYNFANNIKFTDDAILHFAGDADITLDSAIFSTNPSEGHIIIGATIGNKEIYFNKDIGSNAQPIGQFSVNSTLASVNFKGANTTLDNLSLNDNTIINFAGNGANVTIDSVTNSNSEGIFKISNDTNLTFNNIAGNSLSSVMFNGDNELKLSDGSAISAEQITTNLINEGTITALGNATLKTDIIGQNRPIKTLNISQILILDNNNSEAIYQIQDINFTADGTLNIQGDANIDIHSKITPANAGDGTVIINGNIGNRVVNLHDSIGSGGKSLGHLQIDSTSATTSLKGPQTELNLVTFTGNTILDFSANAGNVKINSIVNNPNEGIFRVSENTNLNFDNSALNALQELNFNGNNTLTLADGNAIYTTKVTTNTPSAGSIAAAGDAILITSNIGPNNPLSSLIINTSGKILTLDNQGSNPIYNIDNIYFNDNGTLELKGDANISLNSNISSATGGDGTILVHNNIGAKVINFAGDIGTNLLAVGHLQNDSTNAKLNLSGQIINVGKLTLTSDNIVNFSGDSANVIISDLANNASNGAFHISNKITLQMDNQAKNSLSELYFNGQQELILADNSSIYTDKIYSSYIDRGTIITKGDAVIKTSDINNLNSIIIEGNAKTLTLDNNNVDAIYNLNKMNFTDQGTLEIVGDANVSMNHQITSTNSGDGTIIISAAIGNRVVSFDSLGSNSNSLSHLDNKSNNVILNFNGEYTNLDLLSLAGDSEINLNRENAKVTINNISNNAAEGKINVAADTTLHISNIGGNSLNYINFTDDVILTLTDGSDIYANTLVAANEGSIILNGTTIIDVDMTGNNLRNINLNGTNASLVTFNQAVNADNINFSGNSAAIFHDDLNAKLLRLNNNAEVTFSKENLVYNIATTEAIHDNYGRLKFADVNLTIGNQIGSSVKKLKEVAFDSTTGKVINLNANIHASDIYFADSHQVLTSHLLLRGNVHLNNSTFTISNNNLNIEGGLNFTGKNIIKFSHDAGRSGSITSSTSDLHFAAGASLQVDFDNLDNTVDDVILFNFSGAPAFDPATITILNNTNINLVGEVSHDWEIGINGNVVVLTLDDGGVVIPPPASDGAEVVKEIKKPMGLADCPRVKQAIRLHPPFEQYLTAPEDNKIRIFLSTLCDIKDEQVAGAVTKFVQSPVEAQYQTMHSNIDQTASRISERLADFYLPVGMAAGEDDMDANDTINKNLHGAWFSTTIESAAQTKNEKQNILFGHQATQISAIGGFDSEITDILTAGAAVTLTNSNIKYADEKIGDKAQITSTALSFYSFTNLFNQYQMNNILTIGTNHIVGHSQRTIGENKQQTAISDYYTNSISLRNEFTREFKSTNFVITPMFATNFNYLSASKYQEVGTDNQNLSVVSSGYNSLAAIAGLRFAPTPYQVKDIAITPSFQIKGQKNLYASDQNVILNLENTTEKINQSSRSTTIDHLSISIDSKFQWRQFSMVLSYRGLKSENYFSNAGSINIKLDF